MGLRKFDGKYFVDQGFCTTKKNATARAAQLRKQGKLVRIDKALNPRTGNWTHYQIWARGK